MDFIRKDLAQSFMRKEYIYVLFTAENNSQLFFLYSGLFCFAPKYLQFEKIDFPIKVVKSF